jgi:hypothetical protein
MPMHAIGSKIRLTAYPRVYEKIIASKYAPQVGADGHKLPPEGADYTFKRIDGAMEQSFDPYLQLPGSLIEAIIDPKYKTQQPSYMHNKNTQQISFR